MKSAQFAFTNLLLPQFPIPECKPNVELSYKGTTKMGGGGGGGTIQKKNKSLQGNKNN